MKQDDFNKFTGELQEHLETMAEKINRLENALIAQAIQLDLLQANLEKVMERK